MQVDGQTIFNDSGIQSPKYCIALCRWIRVNGVLTKHLL